MQNLSTPNSIRILPRLSRSMSIIDPSPLGEFLSTWLIWFDGLEQELVVLSGIYYLEGEELMFIRTFRFILNK